MRLGLARVRLVWAVNDLNDLLARLTTRVNDALASGTIRVDREYLTPEVAAFTDADDSGAMVVCVWVECQLPEDCR